MKKALDKGLDEEKIKEISKIKNEPKWMLDFRLDSYNKCKEFKMPSFGPQIKIDLDDIVYYKSTNDKIENSWDKVDKDVSDTFDKIGLQKAEKEYLGGVGAQL